MKIVIDAMGSDNAPNVEVEGAIQGIEEFGYDVVLVGMEGKLKEALEKHQYPEEKISIRGASQVVDVNEPAAISVRRKRDSSIVVALNILKKREADAFIGAGNTGAVVCAATLGLRLLPSIERPGIATVMPSVKGMSLLIDVGANIDPKPIHLLQYAIMGDAYSRFIMGKEDPKVGLLNIGEEETKGTGFVKETHTLLDESKLNFIGNIEGKDIYAGNADVVVCDGFVGNVILKISESVVDTIMKLLKWEIKSNIMATIGAALSSSAFSELRKKMDYSEYGGAPLLGVDGACIICHGSSNAKAIKNAMRAAGNLIEQEVNRHIVEELESY